MISTPSFSRIAKPIRSPSGTWAVTAKPRSSVQNGRHGSTASTRSTGASLRMVAEEGWAADMTIPEEEETVSDASRMESEVSRCTAEDAAQGRGAGTPDDPFRVAIVGYGLAGSTFHAPFVATTPGLRVAAIVTGDAERRGRAERDHPGVRVVPSADELWPMADDLDLVVVASPNRTHVPLGLAAVEAGLPVLVDKPLAARAEDAERLVSEGERRGVMVTVYQNRRFDGDFLTLRRLLADGALGRVLRFESRFERWRPLPKGGWRERGDPEDAGGLLFDLGAHLVDQALVLFGPATRVYAELDRRRSGMEVDDDSFVAITHAGGVRSHLWMSAVAAQQAPRFRVLGDAAAWVKHGYDPQEDALRVAGAWPRTPGWGAEPREQWGTLGTSEESTLVRTEPGSWPAYWDAIAAALRGDAPPPVNPRDAVAVLRVIEAARRSHERGTVEPIGEATG
jgi:predicted dehydrogenase